MTTILDEILARKKADLEHAKQRRAQSELEEQAAAMPPPRDFTAALRAPGPRIIAECKRRSPSKGLMVDPYDPVALARAYAAGGCAAVSVLTDEPYFGGRLDHLIEVKKAVSVPVMRKDFVIDEYQVFEARANGADSFLLLSGVLDRETLERLLEVGRSLGMEPLVESHTDEQLETALATDARVLGINNRNLTDFSVDLSHARSLAEKIRSRDPARVLVCESGIHGPDDVAQMRVAGFQVFLVGEAVATAADPKAAVKDLISTPASFSSDS